MGHAAVAVKTDIVLIGHQIGKRMGLKLVIENVIPYVEHACVVPPFSQGIGKLNAVATRGTAIATCWAGESKAFATIDNGHGNGENKLFPTAMPDGSVKTIQTTTAEVVSLSSAAVTATGENGIFTLLALLSAIR